MHRKVIGAWLGVLLAATLAGPLVAATAASAVAWDPGPTVGSIEICKTSVTGTLAVTGPFTFTVSGGNVTSGNGTNGNTVTVGVNSCSPVLGVDSSSVTITEASATWYHVATGGITEGQGGAYLTSSSVTNQTATVSTSGTVATGPTSVVYFENTIVPGYLEVCKNAASGSGLTGTFTFTVTSASMPTANVPWTAQATANVGACSLPVEMPAGNVTVTENGTNLYVTAISASFPNGSNALTTISPPSTSLIGGWASVVVNAGDQSTQTDVWFTNNVVLFKICKVWDPTVVPANGTATDPVATYPFTYVATTPGATTGTTVNVSVVPGYCSLPAAYPAGTTVAVTEGIVPGTKIETIANTGAISVGTTSINARTDSTILGTPVPSNRTIAGSPGNEGVVTYTNQPASPGQLKICKFAGTTPGPPIGNSFSFTVTGISAPVVVPLGQCVIVLNSSGTPNYFPFNSTVTITETASTGNAVSAISTLTTNVTENGAPNLSEPVVVTPANLTAGTISVMTGESSITEVDYTDVDPPVVTTGGNSGVSGNSGNSGSVTVNNPGNNAGLTTGANSSVATSVAGGIAILSSTATTISPTVSGLSTVKALTASQKKALLKKDEKALTNLKSLVANEQKLFNHSVGKKAVQAAKKLAALKAELRALNTQIKLLK